MKKYEPGLLFLINGLDFIVLKNGNVSSRGDLADNIDDLEDNGDLGDFKAKKFEFKLKMLIICLR
jgi:hypothetical protein